jgi:Spy/CpxP family protein refolding chaperone
LRPRQREAEAKTAEIRRAEEALAPLVEADRADLARVEEQVKAIAQLQAELRLGRIRTVEQGKALLTPEQLAKLKTLTRPRS